MNQITLNAIARWVLTILTLFKSPCGSLELINMCFKSWSHCLFSHGSYYSSPCLKLSQAYCTKLFNGSYPIELVDDRSTANINKFLQKKLPGYPVILNAYRVTDQTYFWVNGNTRVDCNSNYYVILNHYDFMLLVF